MRRPHVVQVLADGGWKVAAAAAGDRAAEAKARELRLSGSKGVRVLSPDAWRDYIRELREAEPARSAAERLETPRKASQSELAWRPAVLVG